MFFMQNNFTKKEIKNSVEYRWRKTSLCWISGIWVAVTVVLFFALALTSLGDMKYITLSLKVWLIVVAIYSAIFLPFVAYYGYKMIYILKHYAEFNSYEVVLDNVSTSYAYRGAVYYTVTINDKGTTKQVSTNAYFSSSMFARFTLEDYNNKKVIGLYDSQIDKFYIIEKVG